MVGQRVAAAPSAFRQRCNYYLAKLFFRGLARALALLQLLHARAPLHLAVQPLQLLVYALKVLIIGRGWLLLPQLPAGVCGDELQLALRRLNQLLDLAKIYFGFDSADLEKGEGRERGGAGRGGGLARGAGGGGCIIVR